ncbi:hypothetical protein Acsp06_27550 [Actinomycetospora sp. NBRC 106375]|uniref:class I SAM-dependent methyltransferase n=1 Tax=Actinomycetospora sp. NBRC 106375 TaxID=3032207 RepID=UPI0024A23583|nr:class I SAM-dependent methyltransferase [Actinomycetospora sp. NBRC 106375]GLZ46570.1 hypothetical protein Acsp06_27550 [Actinomycetospora sp. NBRC 106375]
MTASRPVPAALGSRDDPHAQARAARTGPLLLHSLTFFRDVFVTLFAARRITTVVEVGVESGAVTAMYADLGATDVFAVDPSPTVDLQERYEGDERLHLVSRHSPAALDDLPVADLYVIDGDHNYAVVRREVDWVLRHAPDALIVLHDVLWPCGRRDQYYAPSTVPEGERHPSSEEGATVWHDDLTPAGFVGLGAFTAALTAGGERNGVLTAVEDALEDAAGTWTLRIVPAVFGLGVVVREGAPGAQEILRGVEPFASSTMLATLENNRLALYTRVLEMQYEAGRHADDADAMAEALVERTRRIEDLDRELARTRRELDEARAPRPEPEPRPPKELARAAVRRLRRAVSR